MCKCNSSFSNRILRPRYRGRPVDIGTWLALTRIKIGTPSGSNLGSTFGPNLGPILAPKSAPLLVQNGAHFCHKTGPYFGFKMGHTLGPKRAPPHFREHSKMRTLGSLKGATFWIFLDRTLVFFWVTFWIFFRSRFGFFSDPILGSILAPFWSPNRVHFGFRWVVHFSVHMWPKRCASSGRTQFCGFGMRSEPCLKIGETRFRCRLGPKFESAVSRCLRVARSRR